MVRRIFSSKKHRQAYPELRVFLFVERADLNSGYRSSARLIVALSVPAGFTIFVDNPSTLQLIYHYFFYLVAFIPHMIFPFRERVRLLSSSPDILLFPVHIECIVLYFFTQRQIKLL